MRRGPGPVVVLATAVALLSFGWPRAGAEDQTVNIPNNSYQPNYVEILSGEQVTWTNTSGVAHTVTSDSCDSLSCNGARKEQDANNIWEVGNINPGSSDSMRFYAPTQDLTMRYHCRYHPAMSGTIRVLANAPTASPTPVATPTPTGGPTPTPTLAPTPTPTGGPTPTPTGGPTPTPTSAPTPTPTGGPTATPGPTPTPTIDPNPTPPPTPSCLVKQEDAIQIDPFYVWLDGVWMEDNEWPGLQRNTYFCNGVPVLPDMHLILPGL